jgi:hypothetical protein
MAILSVQEQTEQGQQLIGGKAQLTRTFTVILSAPIPLPQVVEACGATLGSPHPDVPDAVVVDVSVDQNRLEGAPPDEGAPPEDVEVANEETREEAQQTTRLPLPPDEILVTELPILLDAEEQEDA